MKKIILFLFIICMGVSHAQNFSTYFGGDNSDEIKSLVIYKNNLFTYGSSNSTSLSYSGYDVFVSKFDLSGVLIWTKIFGSDSEEFASKIKIKSNGNIIIGGYTNSLIFYGDTTNGFYDSFVMELDTNGNIIWSNTYGGSSSDISYSIDLDSNDNIYIAGKTASFDYPIQSAYQSFNAGPLDAFISKTDQFGEIIWSTYFGGISFEDMHDMIVNSNSDVIITGETNSIDLPILNCYQCFYTGAFDAYLASFDTDGFLKFSTYFGGNGSDDGYSLSSNGDDIYFCGNTNSIDLPTTSDSYQSNYGGGSSDFFISKFDKMGNFHDVTYVGDTLDEYIKSSFYKNGLLISSEINNNVFVFRFNDVIFCSDTLPGMYSDYPNCIVSDGYNIYIGGSTSSPDFLIFNEHQSTQISDDGFITKLSDCVIESVSEYINDIDLYIYPNPANDMINVNIIYDKIYLISLNGYHIEIKNGDISNISSGIYVLKIYHSEKVYFRKLTILK